MATGALDANGIWQYGEDDSEPTFSGLINKLASSTSNTVTRLEELSGLTSTQYTTHRRNLRVGLVPISPGSVGVTSGSASTTSLGHVTFSTAQFLTLNNVFSADYTNYRIILDINNISADNYLYFQLITTAGTFQNTGYYSTGQAFRANGTSFPFYNANAGGALWGNLEANFGAVANVSADICNPYESGKTYGTSMMLGGESNIYTSFPMAFAVDANVQCNGIFIYTAAAANWSGTIQVFGYNK